MSKIPIKRYWSYPTGVLALEDSGFLIDPESEYAYLQNKDVYKFDDINSDKKCSLFLGEPGSGKTTAIKQEIKNREGEFLYIDLSEYGDEGRLISDVFNSQTTKNNGEAGVPFVLVLDSLDACSIYIETIEKILISNLYKINKDHVKVWILSRTGYINCQFLKNLKAIFGNQEVSGYEITPLTRNNVKNFCKNFNVNDNLFFEFVFEKELVPLCHSIRTLKYITGAFSQGDTNRSSTEYFRNAISILCSEHDESRDINNKQGRLSPSKYFSICSRIAALMVFSAKDYLNLEENYSPENGRSLCIPMIQEGEESTEYSNFEFESYDVLRSVKDTALFTSRDIGHFSFVNDEYKYFLAANYLHLKNLSVHQIKSLMFLSSDDNLKVVPQLNKVASWLSIINTELAEDTIHIDPKTVLSGDASSLNNKNKRSLVQSLLDQFERKEITDSDWGLRGKYVSLNHPDLGIQLTPYIKDRKKSNVVRRVVIDIAISCSAIELASLFLKAALDKKEDVSFRVRCASAVRELGDKSEKSKLRAFVSGLDIDTDDELKGEALRALWPEFVTIEEVTKAISVPKNGHFFGSYYRFLHDFPSTLRGDNLAKVLDWVAQEPIVKRNTSVSYFDSFYQDIFVRAWDFLNEAKIQKGFVKAVVPRLLGYTKIMPDGVSADKHDGYELADSIRREMLLWFAKSISKYQRYMLFRGGYRDQPEYLKSYDLEWLIDKLNSYKQKKIRKNLIRFISDIFETTNMDHIEKVCGQIDKLDNDFNEVFKPYFEPVDILSQEAAQMKLRHQEHEEFQRKLRERRESNTNVRSVLRNIETLLNQAEDGDLDAWWQICLELTCEDEDLHYGDERLPDVTNLPGWKLCSETAKNRMIEIAKNYVLSKYINERAWVDKGIIHRPILAAYKALFLLKIVAHEFIDQLSDAIWKKWIPIILLYPLELTDVGEGQEIVIDQILRIAFEKDREKCIKYFKKSIDIIERDRSAKYLIKRFLAKTEPIWCQEIVDILRIKIEQGDLAEEIFYEYGVTLLNKGDVESVKYLREVSQNKSTPSSYKVKAILTLFEACNNPDNWKTIMRFLEEDTKESKLVAFSLPNFDMRENNTLFDKLGAERAGDLYVWICRTFPPETDPNPDGMHVVTDREALGNFRSKLFNKIKNDGTQASMRVLNRLTKLFPENDYLPYHISEARVEYRRKNWDPLSPKELLKLVRNEEATLILNEDHFVEAVLRSLEKLEKKLQGETPQAIYLWDLVGGSNKYRPKNENEFSDFIKIHLSEDLKRNGIISLREVEMRRSTGKKTSKGKMGERIDIYLCGYIPSRDKFVKMVIEVKGCWNAGVNTAMKDQLTERYLDQSGIHAGIYLIGWFPCNQWDGRDSRKNKVKSKTQSKARDQFEKQAKLLSSQGGKIRSVVLNCALR